MTDGPASTDDEVLGKAYDARLMRRLLQFMYPHRLSIGRAFAAIVGLSVLQLAPPSLEMCTRPSSEPAQKRPVSWDDSTKEKIVQ